MMRRIFGFLCWSGIAVAQQYMISTLAGGPGAVPTQLERGQSLEWPVALTVDRNGVVYFSSARFNSVFKLNGNGTVTRVAGSSRTGFSGDGGPARSATLSLDLVGATSPGGLALDTAGNLFVADSANNRIRRVSPSGAIVTVAGTGEYGFSGDGGPAINAKLGWPTGIAIDSNGNLYIAERGNVVRRV